MLDGAGNEERPSNQPKPPRTHRAWTPLARALAATGDRWTLMIAVALGPGRLRLSTLHARLPGVSTGVLERYVQQMVELGLITRTRFKEMPPRVELELTDMGRELLPIAGALARWGMRNQWSPAHARERVDAGALLRLLPLLLEEETGLPAGSLEALITDGDPPFRCVYEAHNGCLRITESRVGAAAADLPPPDSSAPGSTAADLPSARVAADSSTWIAALGPDGDRAGLRISGDAQLVASILDALARQRVPGLPQWAA